eukprot:413008-Rhodomonas_salina.4
MLRQACHQPTQASAAKTDLGPVEGLGSNPERRPRRTLGAPDRYLRDGIAPDLARARPCQGPAAHSMPEYADEGEP